MTTYTLDSGASPQLRVDDLPAKYPELCAPTPGGRRYPFAFGVGDGWYGILDALLACIVSDVRQRAKRYETLRAAEGGPLYKGGEPVTAIDVERARLAHAAAREALPVLVQVKEKFGGLRFYVDGGSNELQAQIELAEAMSYRTCETCGAPGRPRSGGWVRTLCDTHAAART